MKRVKAACIRQILHFMLKEDMGRAYAEKMVDEELSRIASDYEGGLRGTLRKNDW